VLIPQIEVQAPDAREDVCGRVAGSFHHPGGTVDEGIEILMG